MTLVGAVRSIVIVRMCWPVLFAASTATARIAFGPSNAGLAQVASYGAVLSVPNCTQEPVAQAVLASVHSKKSMCVTS